MAGTQVRCANETGPMSIGENRRDAAASAADGARPAEAVKRIRCGGRHTVFAPRHSGRRRTITYPCNYLYITRAACTVAVPPAACHGPAEPIAMAPVAGRSTDFQGRRALRP